MEAIKSFDKYAIFQRGMKQYQAIEGKTIEIDRIEGQAGDKLEFDQVLFRKTGDEVFEIGKPYLANPVRASIVKQMQGVKTIGMRFKRRKKVRVQKNDRAQLTIIRIESI